MTGRLIREIRLLDWLDLAELGWGGHLATADQVAMHQKKLCSNIPMRGGVGTREELTKIGGMQSWRDE